MKKINLLSVLLAAVLSLSASSVVRAQEETPQPQTNPQNFRQQNRPRIMEALNLSREQVQQLRRINQERRQIMQDAQQNWRLAQRNLDLAIYSDNATEEEIKTRVKEAQSAHAELIKERAITEFLIRKVLTPEQLQKFRELRERFRRQANNPENQNPPRQRPLNRLNKRRDQIPHQPSNF